MTGEHPVTSAWKLHISTDCDGPDCQKCEDFMDLLQELDEALHPWGEPGVVPTEPGEYFVLTHNEGIRPAVGVPLLGRHDFNLSWYWWPGVSMRGSHLWLQGHATAHAWRFRRRWTPVVPRG